VVDPSQRRRVWEEGVEGKIDGGLGGTAVGAALPPSAALITSAGTHAHCRPPPQPHTISSPQQETHAHRQSSHTPHTHPARAAPHASACVCPRTRMPAEQWAGGSQVLGRRDTGCAKRLARRQALPFRAHNSGHTKRKPDLDQDMVA